MQSPIDSRVGMCNKSIIVVGLKKSELNEIARAAEDGKNMRRPVCLVFTSEVTVEVRGTGMGGPCQEVALATAIELSKRHYECETFRVGFTFHRFNRFFIMKY